MKGENYNVIALIGDGSLSGGEAFEGLNNASVLGSNIIIIVNDNEMSIAENQGGLYENLALLRETNGKAELNYFKSFGFDYYYLENGNDIEDLIDVFESVKDTNKPTVVHIHTLKGKGYKPAEENKEWGHWALPNFMDKKSETVAPVESYASITTDFILEKQKMIILLLQFRQQLQGQLDLAKVLEMLWVKITQMLELRKNTQLLIFRHLQKMEQNLYFRF